MFLSTDEISVDFFVGPCGHLSPTILSAATGQRNALVVALLLASARFQQLSAAAVQRTVPAR
jgi:hypothetical protein